jgi:hypothetical protein
MDVSIFDNKQFSLPLGVKKLCVCRYEKIPDITIPLRKLHIKECDLKDFNLKFVKANKMIVSESEVGDMLTTVKNVQKLFVSDSIFNGIYFCKTLTYLNLEYCDLKIPQWQNTNIESIRIISSKISGLPKLPKKLKYLRIIGCGLKKLPKISKKIKLVDFEDNKLQYMVCVSKYNYKDNPLNYNVKRQKYSVPSLVDFAIAAADIPNLIREQLNVDLVNSICANLYDSFSICDECENIIMIGRNIIHIPRCVSLCNIDQRGLETMTKNTAVLSRCCPVCYRRCFNKIDKLNNKKNVRKIQR